MGGFRGPIGLTIQLLRNTVFKGAADKAGAADTRPAAARRADDGGHKGPIGHAVQFVQTTLGGDKAAAEPPLDEEGFGKAGSPGDSGVPRDPIHARSKRLSLLALLAVGFGLAVDFSMSLMSIQPLYYLLSGPQHVYGLTFGAYDLTSMLFAPIFGLWTDHSRRFRPQILLGAAVNAVGNLLYAFVYLADQWSLMLVSRAIAGVGAATLGIGASYITQTTTSERRQVVLGRYRVTQNVARMAGPFVGYLFIGLPNVDRGASTALKLFNWYTIPGWAAFVVVVVLGAVFAWWFVDPTDENEHRVKPDAAANLGPPSPERIARFRSFTLAWLFLSFLTIFSFSGFTANLFALFAGQFHAITTQGENWQTYIAVGIGAAVSAWLFRRMVRLAPRVYEERKLCVASNVILLATWLLVIPYQGSTSVPHEALYFVSTALAGFTVVINQASLEVVFSKKVTQFADVVGGNVGKYMGAYFMAASAGRFAGPLVVAGVTRIATPSGQTNYCTDLAVDANGNVSCNGPPEQQCLITGDQYYVQGCVLYNMIPMYAVMAGLHVFIGLAMVWVLRSHWSYDNGAAAEDGSASPIKGSLPAEEPQEAAHAPPSAAQQPGTA